MQYNKYCVLCLPMHRWLYLSRCWAGFEAHGLQTRLQLGHIHSSISVRVQLSEQLLVRRRRRRSRIICAPTVREKQLPYDVIHDTDSALLQLHTDTNRRFNCSEHTHKANLLLWVWHFWFLAAGWSRMIGGRFPEPSLVKPHKSCQCV